MIGINLLPDVKKEFLKAQRMRNFVTSVAIIAMFVAGGVVALLVIFIAGQGGFIAQTQENVKKKQAIFESKPEVTKYLTIQNQLASLGVLHDAEHKILFSRVFDYLPQLNPASPNNVELTSVRIVAETSSMVVTGGTGSFKSLDTFKNTLEQAKYSYRLDDETKESKLFSTVTLKSAGLSSSESKQGVVFEFELVYSKEIFSPSIVDYQLIVPKLIISDADSNAPKDLFVSNEGKK